MSKKQVCIPFEEAREIARKLKFRGLEDYVLYVKNNRHLGIPAYPKKYYKDKWISYPDWFGKKSHSHGYYLEYNDAIKVVHEEAKKYKIDSIKKWNEYCRSENKIKSIPSDPNKYYKNNGWTSFSQWIGNGKHSCKDGWMPFDDAKILIKSKGFNSVRDYRNSCNELKLPYNPFKVYLEKWVSWNDWLGCEKLKHRSRFLEFNKARELVLVDVEKYNIDSQKKWKEYCVSGKKPNNIPCQPHTVYKDSGWISLGHWLNNGNTRGCSRKYNVNEDFFKTWTHDMAYIFGFWVADGCIRSKKCSSKIFSITQHKDDKYILEDILVKMGSNHPLIKVRNCFDIFIGSKKIFNDIVAIGGKERKSMDIDFPNIPEEFMRDFIRGYFDGDGCISKKGKSYTSNFVSGSLKFLEKLNEILKFELPKYNNGVKLIYGGHIQTIKERMAWINGKYWKFKQNYRLYLSTNDTRRLRDFMYSDPNCMKLKRKYDKFLLSGNVKQLGGRILGAKNNVHKIQEQLSGMGDIWSLAE